MKLITKEIWKKLPALGTTDGKQDDQVTVHVKMFTPDAGATWFITEADPVTGRLFGLCDLGLGFPEIGYVMLSEIEAVRGKLGLPVERDLHWKGTLADAWKQVGGK